ncbi:Replication protein A 70 kDa DNA-binding subunit [Symbiodinium microadriaticum]|uniref:Replication protein A 70 kDa DNA-binding subunit n=1 Tax=Symbiodinium microadriaticum TaxID=2951 RepID=A0A1Q9D228_SYMMI|nr:Replication protein A 70 kDa DNA-binding subunit [Symbiodinium microadriaticum]
MSHISALLVKGHLLLQLQAKGTVHPAMSIDFCDGQRWRRKSACCANATWLKGPKSCKEDDSCFCPLRLKGTSMTGADFFPIRELSTYQTKWTIKGRVTSKAPLRTFKQRNGSGQGKVFHVELLDAEGGEIRASFFNDAADKHFELLEVGKCFTLSKGQVKLANRQYNACKHRYELVFDKACQVDGVADDGKIDTVKFSVVELRSVKGKTLPCSVDVCGIVKDYDKSFAFTSKDGKDLVKRTLTLADDSGISMQVTIWGDRAKKEDSEFEGNPVVAMKGVSVKVWQGGLSGSLMEGGSLAFNPDMPEAHKVKSWWTQGGHAQSLTFISQTSGGGGARIAGKLMDVLEMKQKSEQLVNEQEMYSAYCRLSSVQLRKRDEIQPLYYNACLEPKEGNGLPCNRRVDEANFCAVCNKTVKAAPRLNLRCRFEDATGNFWVTTFHPAAEKVLGMTAQEVADIEKSEGREVVEAKLKSCYYAQILQVQLRAKPDNYNGEQRTNVSCPSAQPINRREHARFMLKEIEEMLAKAVC